MDGYLLLSLLLAGTIIGSVWIVRTSQNHAANRTASAARLRRAAEEIREIDAVADGIGRLAIPDELRALLRNRRARLAQSLDAHSVPERPTALDSATPVEVVGSQLALTNCLGELQNARRYLRELDRRGELPSSERVPLSQALSALSVRLQAESFAAWAELPGVEPNVADSHLRDAQELLNKSLHLDRAFAERIATFKARQEVLSASRLQRARADAEARAEQERLAQAATPRAAAYD